MERLHSRDAPRADEVFCFGDMNYRINGPRDSIEFLAKQHALPILLRNDQLVVEQDKGHIFTDFQEGKITFPPTYKYDIGLNRFDTSKKKRIPAFTDRILYKSAQGDTKQVTYDSIANMWSDHRPVFAQFLVKLVSPCDS
jgi:phosphatidylinositol-bisphosphatase